MICERDAKYTSAFDAAFTAIGVCLILTPEQAPQANVIAKQRILSARRQCLDRMLIVGRRHRRHVLTDYIDH